MGFTLGTDETILAPKTPAEMLPLLALSGLKVLGVMMKTLNCRYIAAILKMQVLVFLKGLEW
jgi:hypothetical protein